MLAHVGGDDRIAFGQVVDLFEQFTRLDFTLRTTLFVRQRLFGLPLHDLLVPFGPDLLARSQTFLAFHLFEHHLHDFLDVADDGDMHLDVLTDRRRIDVHMDDRLDVRSKVTHADSHAVIKTRTYGAQRIAVAHRHVGRVTSMHAEHA